MTDGEQRERFATLETLVKGMAQTLDKFIERYDRDEKAVNGRIDTLQTSMIQNDKRIEILEFDVKDAQEEIGGVKKNQITLDHDVRATAEHQDKKIADIQMAPMKAAYDSKKETRSQIKAAAIGAGVTAVIGAIIASISGIF